MTEAKTLFLRLEGPLQAWGDTSKFIIRRTMDAPTKSGVLGLLCCAMGLSRQSVRERLPELIRLAMGVRIDRRGIRWWDYHTVGAKIGLATAGGVVKTGAQGTLITRREYLADASFLVVLQGDTILIEELINALIAPKWTLYLGRKSCIPSRPILEGLESNLPDLISALKSIEWTRRFRDEQAPDRVDCLLDWSPTSEFPETPDDAQVWYDVPTSFDPPSHQPRFVIRSTLGVGRNGEIAIAEQPMQSSTPPPPRPRANYTNLQYRKARAARLLADHYLCVFCKSPATTVQHVTYKWAGGSETQEDLRSLCRLCHDAVTMIEYGMGMGLDRINPEEPRWRERIIQKREEIVKFRSLETRRRRLSADEVE